MPSLTSSAVATHPDVPPFPPPQTFDILPEINALISRLHVPGSSSSNSTDPSTTDSLAPKDLHAAAVPIKLKIQKAHAAVQALPDVGRTVEEQEREIRALERRNESLRERVQKLARLAGEARGEGHGDIAMSEDGAGVDMFD